MSEALQLDGVDSNEYFRRERMKQEIAYAETAEAGIQRIMRMHTDLIIPPTYRDYAMYKELLGIEDTELGDVVLDLGSGFRDNFARSPENADRTVVSVNPLLSLSADRTWRTEARFLPLDEDRGLVDYRDTTIAANAQNLPFADEAFDSVVSLFAVPYYLEARKLDYLRAMLEVFRVLKPGGVFITGPITDTKLLHFSVDAINCTELLIQLELKEINSENVAKITKL
jgi:SAM-dependent methyltransferase